MPTGIESVVNISDTTNIMASVFNIEDAAYLTSTAIENANNNVIIIDSSNIRMGIKTYDPQYELDISGTLRAKYYGGDICLNTGNIDLSSGNIYIRNNAEYNSIKDKDTIVLNNKQVKHLLFINESNQTFFEIMTQQPNKFNKLRSQSNNPVTIDIFWNYDNILAKNEGNIMYNNNADNKLYKKLIPHIDSIVFEISGNANGNSWQKIYNISFGDTSDASNILYTDIVKHTLTNTQTHVSNFAQSDGFQVRVYGINDASENPSISDRAIIFDVSFNRGATVKPSITSMTSTTISGDITITSEGIITSSNPNATIHINVEPNGTFTTNEISYNYTSTIISNNSQRPNENYINHFTSTSTPTPIYNFTDQNFSVNSNEFDQTLNPLYSGREYTFKAQVKTNGSGIFYSDISTINFPINRPSFTHPSINSISNFFNKTPVEHSSSLNINYIANTDSNIAITSTSTQYFPVTDKDNYGYNFSGNSHASLTIDVDNNIKTGVNYNTWGTNGQLSHDGSANYNNYFNAISISDYTTNKHIKGYYIKGSYKFKNSIDALHISSISKKNSYNFKVKITNKVSPTTIINEYVHIDNLTQDASINLNGSLNVTGVSSYNIFGITYKNNFDLSGNFDISNANGICELFAPNAIKFTDTESSNDNDYTINTNSNINKRNLLTLVNTSINSHGNYSVPISDISINNPNNQRTGARNNINFRVGIKNLYQTNYSYNNINYIGPEFWYYDSANISKHSDLSYLNIYQFKNTITSTGSSPSLTELSNSLIEMKLDNSANNYTMGFRYGVFDSDQNHEAMSSNWDDLSYGTVKNKTLDINFKDSTSNNNYKWIIFKIDFTDEYGYSEGNNTFNINTLFGKLCINTDNITSNLVPTSNNAIGLIHLYNTTNNYWGILNNTYDGNNKWFENSISSLSYNNIKTAYGVKNIISNVKYIQLNSIKYRISNYKCFIYIGVKNYIG